MDIKYSNEWMYFYNGSSRLEIQLNSILEKNIKILIKISNDVDDYNITKKSHAFYDMRINHWKQDDLRKAIKVLELFLRGSKLDKDLLYTLPYNLLREIYYHRI